MAKEPKPLPLPKYRQGPNGNPAGKVGTPDQKIGSKVLKA